MNLMGIDIGTTGCKAAIFDEQGNKLVSAYREYEIIRAQHGQAELDAQEVWNGIVEIIISCTAKVTEIAALSVASMGEAMVPVNHNGDICGNSVLGTDTRGDKYLERFISKIDIDKIYHITGQPAGGGYALPYLCRVMMEEPELYRKTVKFFSWADFVTYKLTGLVQMNYSLAARTLLFDLSNRHWSKPLLDAAGIDCVKLPKPVPSGQIVSHITQEMSRKLGLPEHIMVVSGSHDQCAAAIGSGVCEPGTAMLGLGTYACMVLTHDCPGPESPLAKLGLNIEPHTIPDRYVSFIYHGSGGALLKWLKREMFRDLPDDRSYQLMDAEATMAQHPAIVLPYFTQTGPLDYAAGGQGLIGGLSFVHTRGDIYKGAMTGIIMYFKSALEQLRESGYPISKLYISGGGAESRLWQQIIADLLDIPVVENREKECGTLGTAIIAGVKGKVFSSYEQAKKQMVKEKHQNSLGNFDRYKNIYKSYMDIKKCGIKINQRM